MSFISGLHLKFTINVWGGLADHTSLRQVHTPGLCSDEKEGILGRMGKNRTPSKGPVENLS